jgi:REP element-mobilizing transposase RayT
MKAFTQDHHRRSIRLQDYDYSQEGMYFITICTHERQRSFGQIENATMYLNQTGIVARKCWLDIPVHYPNVVLHEFIVMPDHIHGIIELVVGGAHNFNDTVVGAQNFNDTVVNVGAQNLDDTFVVVGAQNFEPPRNERLKIIPRSVGSIIRGYKIGVTKWFRGNQLGTRIWQRNYYEHIIRNEKSFQRISQYIINNPPKMD